MRVELMFPGRFITAADLLINNKGKDLTVTIKRIFQDSLQTKDGKSKKGWCVEITRTDKMWVLNKTNALALADLYGPEADKWIGKKCTLYAARVQAFGQMVDAIRVRPDAPANGGGGKKDDAPLPSAPPPREPGDDSSEDAAQ